MDPNKLVAELSTLLSLPETYYRAQKVLADPMSHSADLAEVIELDTAMTAQLLKLVNCALYRFPGKIDRVDHAISLVGRSALQDLVLATAATHTFRKLSPDLVDMSTFWHHSVYTALLSKQLAARCNPPPAHSESMFIAGLLHDVGQLVLYQTQPELAAQTLAQAEPTDIGLYQSEQNIFGFTHADVGAELLNHWRLPLWLQDVVAHHHEPSRAKDNQQEAYLLHLANFIANRVEPGRNITKCEPRLDSVAWTKSDLNEDVVEPVLEDANTNFMSVLEIIVPGKILI